MRRISIYNVTNNNDSGHRHSDQLFKHKDERADFNDDRIIVRPISLIGKSLAIGSGK